MIGLSFLRLDDAFLHLGDHVALSSLLASSTHVLHSSLSSLLRPASRDDAAREKMSERAPSCRS